MQLRIPSLFTSLSFVGTTGAGMTPAVASATVDLDPDLDIFWCRNRNMVRMGARCVYAWEQRTIRPNILALLKRDLFS
jgi:hypothetical protein